MLKHNNIFTYPELSRYNSADGKRFYRTKSGDLPSVTTILSSTSEKSGLDEWIDRVGKEEAESIKNTSARIGSRIHDNIEQYILGNKDYKAGNYVERQLTDLIIRKGLSKLSCYFGTEVSLYYPEMYAGSADLVAGIDEEIVIVDFKNARNERKEEWIEDYFLQLVAYGEAHNRLYGTEISRGMIMMATLNGKYQEFEICNENYKKYRDKWFERVYNFYQVFLGNNNNE